MGCGCIVKSKQITKIPIYHLAHDDYKYPSIRIQSDTSHRPTQQNCLRNILNLYIYICMFACLSFMHS